MPKRVSRFPLPAADSIGDACESAASQLMSDILLIHAAVTLPLGGASGVLSYELLDSAAHRPFATFGNDVFYETGLEQAAALLESLVLNHAFEDGNKRTALAACLYFLIYPQLRGDLIKSFAHREIAAHDQAACYQEHTGSSVIYSDPNTHL